MGTRAFSKVTRLRYAFHIIGIFSTVIPSALMSASRKLIPRCFGASGSVRASMNIQSAPAWAPFHILEPLSTKSSPSSTARVWSEARSEPASGSEYPWAHVMSAWAMRGKKYLFCSSEP